MYCSFWEDCKQSLVWAALRVFSSLKKSALLSILWELLFISWYRTLLRRRLLYNNDSFYWPATSVLYIDQQYRCTAKIRIIQLLPLPFLFACLFQTCSRTNGWHRVNHEYMNKLVLSDVSFKLIILNSFLINSFCD